MFMEAGCRENSREPTRLSGGGDARYPTGMKNVEGVGPISMGLLPLLWLLVQLPACERKAVKELAVKEVSAPETDAPEPSTSPRAAEPELVLDPAIEDKGAPFAGLRVRSVGEPLGSSRRLVVLFHGYGARGDDLVPLATRLNMKTPATYVLPEAPFALGSEGRAWFRRGRENFDEGLSYARAVMEFCAARHPDVELTIGGFSQGAMLTANLLVDAPPQLVGALVLSPADHLPFAPSADTRHVPVFLSHGTRDQVLPFAGGVNLKEQLENVGYPVTFFQFEGRHQIPPGVVDRAAEFVSSLYGVEGATAESPQIAD